MTQISDPSAAGFSPAGWALAVLQEGDYQQALGEFLDGEKTPGDLDDFNEGLDWAVRMATPTGGDAEAVRARMLAESTVAAARGRSEAVQAYRDDVDAKVRDLLAGKAVR